MKVFVGWSGGKDCCLACHNAIKQGHEVKCLLTFTDMDGMLMSHKMDSKLLIEQSNAIGIPILLVNTTTDRYNADYERVLSRLKNEGFDGGVFGYITQKVHRRIIEDLCYKAGLVPLFPLWNSNCNDLLKEFFNEGFKAIIVSSKMGNHWLFKDFDADTVDKMRQVGALCLCGESMEYHTFVTNGPMFSKEIDIIGVGR